jgi:type II secretory pathway pseudopilin PulG
MKVSSSRGSALLVSILLMMILSVMMIFLLERILPYSRTVRGIENSAQASYSARSSTEEILTRLRADNPAGVKSAPTLTNTASGAGGNESRVLDSDTIIPSPGYGNSEGDSQWNAIGPGRPVQLILGANVGKLNGLKIEFRVPRF